MCFLFIDKMVHICEDVLVYSTAVTFYGSNISILSIPHINNRYMFFFLTGKMSSRAVSKGTTQSDLGFKDKKIEFENNSSSPP